MNRFYLTAVAAVFIAITSISASAQATFRSNVAAGNWNVSGSWALVSGSDADGVPDADDSVFVQASHAITLTANEACNDLHISTGTNNATVGGDGLLALGSNTLEVNGKLRCYFATLGTTPGTSSPSVPVSPITITAASAGRMSFVGSSRNITNTGEWAANNTGALTTFAIEINLTTGQTATMQTSIKASSWSVISGTLDAQAVVSADNGTTGQGDITIGAAGTIKSNQSAGNTVFRATGSTRAGALTVSGTLQLTGTSPNIAMNTIAFNGTVDYANSGAQTLAIAAFSGANPSAYTNLTLSGTSTKTLGLNTTVNGTLTRGGTASLALGGFTLSYGSNAVLVYAGTAAQTTGPELSSSPPNVTNNNSVGVVTMGTNASVSNSLTVAAGTFDQGASFDLTMGGTTGGITVSSGSTLRNLGTGDLTVGPGGVSNAGTINYNANGTACGDADSIVITSTLPGTPWTGSGTFSLTDVTVSNQSGTAIILVNSGTNGGSNGANWVFVDACTGNTYTWIGGLNADWQVATNWSPTRTVPATNDVLIFDGDITPAPTITNVPTQTIGAFRVQDNNINVTLNAASVGAPHTLTVGGASGDDLEIAAGTFLTLATTNALRISIQSGSTGSVNGQIIFQDGAHRLIGNAASAILFHSGADFTTATGFTGNAFGSGGVGDGATNSIQFESGTQYFHNAGDSPFGATGSGPVCVFQTGSEVQWLLDDDVADGVGFQASGRTYANLVIGSTGAAVDATDSGSGNFQFNNLVITSTGSDDSSLTFTGSGTSTVTIKGNITSTNNGLGGTLADVNLTAGSGGIQIDAGGTITFGNILNTRSIFFGSDATIVSGTTLNLSRLVQMGFTANGVVTDNGTIVPNFSSIAGYIIGAVRKTSVPASYTYPVGKVTGYTPVELSSATGAGDLTVRAVGSQHANTDDSTSLDEYWTLTLNGGSLTTNLKFTYLDSDVDGIESNYRVIRISGSTIVNYPATILNTSANTAEVSGISGFSDWTLGEPLGPSAVNLARFNAVKFSDGVQLNWETGFEVDNLGYHVYREKDGVRTRVTPSVVAGSALKVGPGNRMTAGFAYSWFDPQGTADATYHLESIDLDGSSQWAGPVTPFAGMSSRRATHRARAKLLDELSATSPINTLVSTWPTVTQSIPGTVESANESTQIQRAIAAGEAVKIEVRNNGWYRLSQAELVAAGLDPAADARLLSLYVNGQEVPISLSTTGSRLNSNDTLEFYGVGLNTPTTDTQTYWLITGDSPGKRMVARRGKLKPFTGDADTTPQNFAVTAERREKLVYFSSLLNGDSENIFGRVVRNQPVDQTLLLTHLDTTATWQPELEVALQGLTSNSHVVTVRVNGTTVGTINYGGRAHPVQKFAVDPSLFVSGDNVVTLTGSSVADVSLIDWIRVSYPHQYKAINDSLTFTAPAGSVVQVDGFTSPNIRVVDVTDPNAPVQLSAFASHADGKYAVKVQTTGGGLRTLIAFKEELTQLPAAVKRNLGSTWSDSSNAADMLIITHKDLRSAVDPLASLRRNQGLAVAVVDVEDLYDEYSYGAHTPFAIKSFLVDAAANWKRKPQYVLLVGDSSWDPRNYFNFGDNDFVPTKLIDTEHNEAVSDDWFADFSNTGVAEMAIGRLPGRSADEIALMVSKILKYEQERELNTPLRDAVLVADTGFEARNAETGNLLPSSVTKTTINRSEIGNDDLMRGAILNALNAGPMLVNYYGHGSVNVWTGAGLLDNDLVLTLSNANRPSVYVMMTCLNGYASDAFVDSLAESSLKAQNGGAAAVWASSGFTEPVSQFALSSEFYRLLFGSQPVRLGEATRAAKAATSNLDVRRTWLLLGDPAMRIR